MVAMDEHTAGAIEDMAVELSRIANAVEEILRLVKEDMKPKSQLGHVREAGKLYKKRKESNILDNK